MTVSFIQEAVGQSITQLPKWYLNVSGVPGSLITHFFPIYSILFTLRLPEFPQSRFSETVLVYIYNISRILRAGKKDSECNRYVINTIGT